MRMGNRTGAKLVWLWVAPMLSHAPSLIKINATAGALGMKRKTVREALGVLVRHEYLACTKPATASAEGTLSITSPPHTRGIGHMSNTSVTGTGSLYEFRLQLERFGAIVESGAQRVLHEAASIAAQAIIVGNEYGDGVAVDTGFARSSFGVGINMPAQGPSEPPLKTIQRVDGSKYLHRTVDVGENQGLGQLPPGTTRDITRAELGDTIFINTMAAYPEYLENSPKTRRFGKHKGKTTEFIAPVEARWPQIVDEAARRVGYGSEP